MLKTLGMVIGPEDTIRFSKQIRLPPPPRVLVTLSDSNLLYYSQP